MAEKKSIYRKGKRNPNGYYSNKRKRKEKITIIIALVLFIFSLIMSFLDKNDIFTWNDLNNATGTLNGPVNPDSNFSIYYLDVGEVVCLVESDIGEHELYRIALLVVRNHTMELIWEICEVACKVLLLTVHEV